MPRRSVNNAFGEGSPSWNLAFPHGNLTATEIIAYFPHWLKSVDVVDRFVRNGGGATVIAAMINEFRVLPGGLTMSRNSVCIMMQNAMRNAGYEGWTIGTHKDFIDLTEWNHDDLDVSGFRPPRETHPKKGSAAARNAAVDPINFRDLELHVRKTPQGFDALDLPRCIAWARSHPDEVFLFPDDFERVVNILNGKRDVQAANADAEVFGRRSTEPTVPLIDSTRHPRPAPTFATRQRKQTDSRSRKTRQRSARPRSARPQKSFVSPVTQPAHIEPGYFNSANIQPYDAQPTGADYFDYEPDEVEPLTKPADAGQFDFDSALQFFSAENIDFPSTDLEHTHFPPANLHHLGLQHGSLHSPGLRSPYSFGKAQSLTFDQATFDTVASPSINYNSADFNFENIFGEPFPREEAEVEPPTHKSADFESADFESRYFDDAFVEPHASEEAEVEPAALEPRSNGETFTSVDSEPRNFDPASLAIDQADAETVTSNNQSADAPPVTHQSADFQLADLGLEPADFAHINRLPRTRPIASPPIMHFTRSQVDGAISSAFSPQTRTTQRTPRSPSGATLSGGIRKSSRLAKKVIKPLRELDSEELENETPVKDTDASASEWSLGKKRKRTGEDDYEPTPNGNISSDEDDNLSVVEEVTSPTPISDRGRARPRLTDRPAAKKARTTISEIIIAQDVPINRKLAKPAEPIDPSIMNAVRQFNNRIPSRLTPPVLNPGRPRIDHYNVFAYAEEGAINPWPSALSSTRFNGPRKTPPFRDLHTLTDPAINDATDWAENIRWAKQQFEVYGSIWTEYDYHLEQITAHRRATHWVSEDAILYGPL